MFANHRTLASIITLVCPRCDSIAVEFLEMEFDTRNTLGCARVNWKASFVKPLL